MKKLSEKQVIWWEQQRRTGKLRFIAKEMFVMSITIFVSLVGTMTIFGEEIKPRNAAVLMMIGAAFGLSKGLLEWDIFNTRYESMFNRNVDF